MIDAVALAQRLIQCPSVTPLEAGALDLMESILAPLGFTCYRVPFGTGAEQVDNLFAYRRGVGTHLSFAGHTDVVPPGDLKAWRCDPFAASIIDAVLIGRGAVDMKGSIAAFVAAISDCLEQNIALPTLSLMLTGDEEGPALHGTQRLLEWVAAQGWIPDVCLVGEPTSDQCVGDTLKVGRRGSLILHITERGTQGHVAYAQQADNPIPRLLSFLQAVISQPLDAGTAHFQPSAIEITSIDVGNTVGNIIPASAHARLNIRFNPLHTGASLSNWLRDHGAAHLHDPVYAFSLSGEAFETTRTAHIEVIHRAVESTTGRPAVLTTTGGTSDARFIHRYCPVIELGLRHELAHHIDESVPVADLHQLCQIYKKILQAF